MVFLLEMNWNYCIATIYYISIFTRRHYHGQKNKVSDTFTIVEIIERIAATEMMSDSMFI